MSEDEEIGFGWEDWDRKSPFINHCIAGSLAGVTEHTLLYPVDTIKTHMQACCSVCPNNPLNSTFKEVSLNPNSKISSVHTMSSSSNSPHLENLESSSLSSINSKPNSKINLQHHGMWTTMRNIMNNGHNFLPVSVYSPDKSWKNPSSLVLSSTVDSTMTLTGVARLWRGVQTMAIGCVPAHALYFSIYEVCKSNLLPVSHLPQEIDDIITDENFQQKHKHLGPIGGLAAGAAATFSHDAIMTPLDTVKQRMQLGYYSGMCHAFETIIKTEGWAGLYRSFGVTILSNLPYGMIMVTTNEFLREYLGRSIVRINRMVYDTGGDANTLVKENGLPPRVLELITTILAACGAGISAATLTSPLDRVKTRLQVQRMGTSIDRTPPVSSSCFGEGEIHRNSRNPDFLLNINGRCESSMQSRCSKVSTLKHSLTTQFCAKSLSVEYVGWRDAFDSIVKEEGVLGLWRGTVPRLVVHTPTVAISWTTYEAAKRWLSLI